MRSADESPVVGRGGAFPEFPSSRLATIRQQPRLWVSERKASREELSVVGWLIPAASKGAPGSDAGEFHSPSEERIFTEINSDGRN